MIDGKELPLGPPAARGVLGDFSLGSSSPDPTPCGLSAILFFFFFSSQVKKTSQSKQLLVLRPQRMGEFGFFFDPHAEE